MHTLQLRPPERHPVRVRYQPLLCRKQGATGFETSPCTVNDSPLQFTDDLFPVLPESSTRRENRDAMASSQLCAYFLFHDLLSPLDYLAWFISILFFLLNNLFMTKIYLKRLQVVGKLLLC